MTMILKTLGTETFCNATANTFAYTSWVTVGNTGYANSGITGGATCVRLFNTGATPFLITRAANATVNIGTITIGANQEMVIVKEPTDLLSSNAATNVIFAAPVAFKSG